MKCPRCQAENDASARFCEDCGARLEAACPSCGIPVTPGKKFCRSCGAGLTTERAGRFANPESYTPKHLVEKILISRAALEGERKQVTVLFADLKGSMELLADRDPEDARKLLDPVLELMMDAVHQYEGTVNQVMGDGIMALFGAPLAHEDHAVRACYAALRMQESVRKYADNVWRSEGVRIQIRVGLNSGEVVVRSIGSDLHMDYTAVGQTAHLAARMEQMAEPGVILLTPDTLQLAEGFVSVQSFGTVAVKGLATPIEIFGLTGASPGRSRLQAAAARGLTTFVGRDAEMDTLGTALEQAKAGKGQVVAVVGEPGMGKSRLFWEFTHSHRTQGCLVLEAASVSYGKATTYLPVIDLLKGYFQLDARDDARKVREKVTGKLVSLDRALEGAVAPLLWLLDVPADDAEWERLDAPLRRQRLLEGLRRLLLRESQVQPLVLVFEDLHWIDGESQAFLDSLIIESVPTARLLLLVNYRPEYSHGWGSKTYYRQLRIDPLPPASADRLLGALLGDDSSVVTLRPSLIERTEGNPFFLEESVRSLVETGALSGERGAYRLVAAPAMLQIPGTVQTILAARIDRLSPDDKRLVQTAAVVGKDVPVALLQAIAEIEGPAVRAGLSRLQAAEFLYEVQLFPEAEYTFKHALTHEVAYGTLLGERRRTLHGRLVAAIERLYGGRLDEQVDRLAQHAQRGEVWDKALTYAQQAGERAMARGDATLAAASFEGALAALAHLPHSRETQALAVDLTVGLARARVLLGEVDRALDVGRRALTLAEALGDGARLLRATARLMNIRTNAGDAAGAAVLGEGVLAHAPAPGNEIGQLWVRAFLAQTYTFLGDYRRVIELCERNREALGSDVAAPPRMSNIGDHPGVLSYCYLALALALIGDFSRATAAAEEGARLCGASATVSDRLFVLLGQSVPAFTRGQSTTALSSLEKGRNLARELNLFMWLPAFAGALGYAYARTGRLEEGLRLLEEAAIQAETRNRPVWAFNLGMQSEALLLAGRPRDARAVAERGLEGARERGERAWEAQCLRALGEAQAYSDPPDAEAARTHLEQALALATELGMRPLVAHCHLGLGKLSRRTGKPQQAQEHFTIAMMMYREMDMRYWREQAEVEQRTRA